MEGETSGKDYMPFIWRAKSQLLQGQSQRNLTTSLETFSTFSKSVGLSGSSIYWKISLLKVKVKIRAVAASNGTLMESWRKTFCGHR